MVWSPYRPLMVLGLLKDDLDGLVSYEETDTVLAVMAFVAMCQGNPERQLEPDYAESARTVWRVEGDGQPPPDISVFEWGQGRVGFPNVRVWYLDQRGSAPRGLGIFREVEPGYPEQEIILQRVRAVLGPACILFGEQHE